MKITISPILNEADYNEALDQIAALMKAEPGTREGAKLDVLATLVEAYEEKHWPIDLPDPVAAIHARMEQTGLRAKDLEPMIGSRGRVSEILSGKRSLTLPMIRRLSVALDLSADILVAETLVPRRTTRTRPLGSGPGGPIESGSYQTSRGSLRAIAPDTSEQPTGSG